MPFILAILLTALSLVTNYPVQPPKPVTLQSYPIPESLSPPQSTPKYSYKIPDPNQPWGVLQPVGEGTYTIRVNDDPRMSAPQELLDAINDLRRRNGAQPLRTDSRLCQYAQSRAEYIQSIRGTDAHKGFIDFLENQGGFAKLGFDHIGENSSFGYKLSGVHLVEWVYMKSPGHNENQLNPAWDHGCAGVFGFSTDIIFATSPM